jgi:hypothetical protein
MKYFELRSENLQNLGGPMGSEYVEDNWVRPYSSIEKAKKAAEKDYKKECGGNPEKKIIWTRKGRTITTQDLRFVMYYITEKKVL